jgi:methyl-accepting chemotaxis protein
VQEAIRYLGLAIDETDPERFAQISVGLIEAVGGIEEFIEGMTTFVSAFATDEHRLMVATDELNRAFEQVGLEVPATRDAMWALMQSLDATTEEGQEQIATLLRLAGVADQYYDLLEDAAEQAQEAAENAAAAFDEINALLTNLATDGWSDPLQSIIDLDAEYQEHVATIQELARANGRAEASEAELTFARQWHARKLEQLSQQILRSAQQLAAQLGYAGFEEFGADNDPVYDAEMGGIGAVEQAVEDRYARELQLLEQLDQYVRGLGISNLSPLNPTERLGEAQAEYERILALAQGGDLDALAQLQGAANAYLTEAQGYYGGVGAYEGIFESVRMALAGLVSAGPQNEQIGPNTPVFGGPVSVTPSSEMVAQNAIERALLAQQLVDHLAALSVALNAPILELMETLGIPIAQLAEDLGINIEQITGASVEALAQLAMDLGLPLGQLVDALGLNLPGLADGVRELAAELGYNVQELVNETGTGLLNLAQYLGADLAELAESLGQDLGALTDANSPIFLALEDTIDALSPDIRDQLQPYLTAITSATNEADANAAIGEAEAAINALPVGIRDLLAPFFAGVDPPGALSDLDYLSNIDGGIVALIEIMEDIAEQMGVNGYAQGTPFVPSNQMAFLHKGEMVIPASVADRVRNGDYYLGSGESMNSSGDSSALERKVEQLIKQNGELLSAIAQNTKVTANEMTKQKPPGYRNAA